MSETGQTVKSYPYADFLKAISGASFLFDKTVTVGTVEGQYDLSSLTDVQYRVGDTTTDVSTFSVTGRTGSIDKWWQTWNKPVRALRALRTITRSSAAAGSEGAVESDWNFTYLKFSAPSGKFDTTALREMTLAGAIQSVASTLENAPLSRWDEFADWLGDDNADFIQTVLGQRDYIRLGQTRLSVPTLTAFDDFADFADWCVTLLGTVGQDSADDYWDSTEGAFVIPLLLGVDAHQSIMLQSGKSLPKGSAKATVSWDAGYLAGGGIQMQDMNGLLDHDILTVVTTACPTFDANYGEDSALASHGFDGILYVYEPTSDTQGIFPQPVPQGWYVANTSTFDIYPFDFANNPIIFPKESAFLEAEVHPNIQGYVTEFTMSGTPYYRLTGPPPLSLKPAAITIHGYPASVLFTASGYSAPEFYIGAFEYTFSTPEYPYAGWFFDYEAMTYSLGLTALTGWRTRYVPAADDAESRNNLFFRIATLNLDFALWQKYNPMGYNYIFWMDADTTVKLRDPANAAAASQTWTLSAGIYLLQSPDDALDPEAMIGRLDLITEAVVPNVNLNQIELLGQGKYYFHGLLGDTMEAVSKAGHEKPLNIIFDL